METISWDLFEGFLDFFYFKAKVCLWEGLDDDMEEKMNNSVMRKNNLYNI